MASVNVIMSQTELSFLFELLSIFHISLVVLNSLFLLNFDDEKEQRGY